MVEDRNKWGEVERIIALAIEDHDDAQFLAQRQVNVVDPKQGGLYTGISLPVRVAQMLRDKGLLREGI